jgi:Flp pilus assembly pilin Flp
MLRMLSNIVRNPRGRRRRGVTSTEYAVMLALMLGVAMSSVQCLGLTAHRVFEETEKAIANEPDE